MAHIHRLIFCCVVALMAWLPASSFSSVPSVLTIQYSITGGAPYFSTRIGAVFSSFPNTSCNTYVVQNGAYYWYTGVPSGTLRGDPLELACPSAQGDFISLSSDLCPSNSLNVGSSCTCNTGFSEDPTHTFCTLPPDPKIVACKALAGQTAYLSAPGRLMPGQTVCGDAGCNVTMSSMVINFIDKTTGVGVGQGDGTITSTPCTYSAPTAGSPTPAASAAANAAPTSCPGGALGQVNGITVCVAYDPNKNTIESTSSSSAASTATGPAGASSSASSSSSSTSCSGAICTTNKTTSTTNGDGSAATTKTDSAVVPKTDFCANNPLDPLCKAASSTFGGTCGAAPACTGDAVMCAIASATFKSNCDMNTAPIDVATSENSAYDAAKLVTGDQTKNLAGNTSMTIGAGSFDSTEFLGAGAGMSDLSITVMGKSIVLPFSVVNPHLDTLGRILQAVTFLMCIVIVSGLRSRG